jgi:ribonuclease P protein component
MSKPFSLGKNERLKSKKDIDTLFLTGKAFFVYPFKVYFSIQDSHPEQEILQFGVSAPKKLYRLAVKRNYLKRITREAFRLNKQELKQALQTQNKVIKVMFVHTKAEDVTFIQLDKSMKITLQKLIEMIQS